MQMAMKKHFGVALRISPIDEIPIEKMFRVIPDGTAKEIEKPFLILNAKVNVVKYQAHLKSVEGKRYTSRTNCAFLNSIRIMTNCVRQQTNKAISIWHSKIV